MSKDKMLFCAHCGERHKPNEKKCPKCKNKLPIKSKLFKNYLKDKIKDDLKGKVTDNLYSIFYNFIKSHLYGTVLTLSIITTAATILTTEISDSKRYKVVDKKPEIIVVEEKEELTNLQKLSIAYFDMYLNDDFTNRNSIYYAGATNYYAPWEFLNSYNIYMVSKDKLTIDKKGVCRSESVLPYEDYPAFNDMEKDGYELTECTHVFNYCTDNTCGNEDGKRTYDFSIDIVVGYVNIENRWYVMYDTYHESRGDMNLFYEVAGNIDEYATRIKDYQ